MKKHLLLFITSIYSATGFCQANNKELNIDFMLRGYIYAQSSIDDSMAAGGFGGSDNVPRKMNDSMKFLENGFFIKIDTGRIGTFAREYKGYTLFMVNTSDTLVTLRAADSRLSVLAEVYYNGKWQLIEYLPMVTCGNSYHRVYLNQNQYWSFEIPKYAGKEKVKLRYRLALGGNRFIYSNEIDTNINPGQLIQKQRYTSNGLMDPYHD